MIFNNKDARECTKSHKENNVARIRTVKPKLFRHEKLFEAEKKYQLPLRLAFVGLFVCCDREGRFVWRPRELKLDVFPYDDDLDFNQILNALHQSGFVKKYEVEGEIYGYVPSWKRHQRINKREMDSILPEPQNLIEPTYDTKSRCVHSPRQVHARGEGNMEGNMEGNNYLCSEQISEVQPQPVDNFAIDFPLKDGTTYFVSQKQIDGWIRTYDKIDVIAELKRCKAWDIANPSRLKTKRGIARHMNFWLDDAQQKKINNILPFQRPGIPPQAPPLPTDWNKIQQENAIKTSRNLKKLDPEQAKKLTELLKLRF